MTAWTTRRTIAAGALAAAMAPGQGFAQARTLIGVALPQDDNPFYIAMLRGIRARAAELGFQVAAMSSNEDKIRQISGVQDLIARGARGILISPIDAVGVNAAYAAAAAARVPIISVARGATAPEQSYHVAMDERRIGREIAEWTARAIGGAGKVALLLGPSGSPTFRNLAAGYAEVVAQNPGMSIAFRTDGPLSRERGLNQAQDALVAHPDLKAIYCANDDVALGAVQAAGRGGRVLVTGMNGVPPALRAVRDGTLAMTIELNPAQWGALGVDVLKSFLDGTPPTTTVYVGHRIIDRTNVEEALRQ